MDALTSRHKLRSSLAQTKTRIPTRYVFSLPPVLAATLASMPLRSHVEPTNLVMPYFVAVLLCAVLLGLGPAILAAGLSVLAFDFFLVPPHHTFAVADTQYLLTFAGLFVVGVVVSTLAARSREQTEMARRRERETADLFELSRELAGAATRERIADVVERHAKGAVGVAVTLLLSSGQEAGQAAEIDLPADRGGDETAEPPPGCLAMRTGHTLQGLMKVDAGGNGWPLHQAQMQVLRAYSTVAALALERASLAEVANQVELLQATERLHSSLLNSISHEIRTPLASIFGVLSSLRAERTGGAILDQGVRAELVENAWEEAGNLNQLVSNLLEMTRLQAGALKVRPEPSEIQDIVGATLTRMGDRLDDRPVRVTLGDDLPLVSLDFVLVVHVLSNLLDNALKYSSAGSEIRICAKQENDEVRISVADRGVGIPPGELEAVFESFYRVSRRHSPGGTGLGLSICRGIMQAHGGRVWAQNRRGGGTLMVVAIPLRLQGPADEVDGPHLEETGKHESRDLTASHHD